MDFLSNVNLILPNVITVVAIIILLLVITLIAMLFGIKNRTDYIINKINDQKEDIFNLTQASKRVERICDAINQRTRSYSNQIRSNKNQQLSQINDTKKKGLRHENKKKYTTSSFSVRSK